MFNTNEALYEIQQDTAFKVKINCQFSGNNHTTVTYKTRLAI